MFVVVGGSAGPHGTCALGRGGARAPGSDEAGLASPVSGKSGPVPPGSGEPELSPPGSGEAGPTSLGSDEVVVTPLNRLGELVADDHQSPFFGYPCISTRQ
jgi:hypothetical protein